MTQLLEKVLTEVYKLPPEKQDTIAAVILEELEDERLRDKAFAESQNKLSELARKVRADIIVKPTINFTLARLGMQIAFGCVHRKTSPASECILGIVAL